MAGPTKAELAAELTATLEQNASYRSQLRNFDSEALALADIITALKPFDKSQSGYPYQPQASSSISRILDAAAARFGIRPNWETFQRLEAMIQLTEQERAELTRFRVEWEIKNRG